MKLGLVPKFCVISIPFRVFGLLMFNLYNTFQFRNGKILNCTRISPKELKIKKASPLL